MVILGVNTHLKRMSRILWIARSARLWALIVMVCCLSSPGLGGQGDREYPLKAAFILNFLKFVEWPPDAFESANSPIVIAIVGRDPFGGVIDQAVQGKNVEGRPIIVRRLKLDSDTRGVHLAFLAESSKEKVIQWLSSRKTLPTLTVSEFPGYAQSGVIINFFIEDGRVRFEINQDAAKRARITISSKLLSLAKLVTGGR